MGIRRSFKDVPDSTGFSLVAVGKHPARMHIDPYQHDAQGNFATDNQGEKVYWATRNGDPMWKMRLEILDGDNRGATLEDNLNFSTGGMKRVKVIYKRGGFATGDEDDIELEPDDLDGSCWWITVEHEPSIDFATKKERPTQRAFKNNGCKCATCLKYDGQNVFINPKITFDGFEPMAAKDAARFAKMATPRRIRAAEREPDDPTKCLACNMGEHTHPAGDADCKCLHVDHPLALCDKCEAGDHRHKLDPTLGCPCEDEMHTPF